MILVYRYRVKNNLGLLNKKARAVNFVWNYCNETQMESVRRKSKWLTGFDLNKLTSGSSRELNLHSGTINACCEQYAKSRSQFKKPWLRFRGRKSLSWIPLKGRDLKINGNDFSFAGDTFKVFKSRELPVGAKIKDGTNFSQDTKGNWFLNVTFEYQEQELKTGQSIGIDLGLKDFATLSNGVKIANPRFYRSLEQKLGKAQRAKKKRLAKSISAKIAAKRRDFAHKESTKLVKQYSHIVVGNVSSKALAQTKMAKSVLDAGWSMFRSMLTYKSVANGVKYEEVSERYTSQTCSCCDKITVNSPKGAKGLAVRQWTCDACDTLHDRDVNAARNILARSGH